MLRYFAFRIAAIIPMLILVSFVAFFLSRNVPQDQVLSYLHHQSGAGLEETSSQFSNELYEQTKTMLGYDKPLFYFNVVPNHYTSDYYLNDENPHQSFFLPSLRWHGVDNQYHHWAAKALTGNLGISLLDGRSCYQKISKAFSWTFLLMILSVGLTMLVGIGLGIWSVNNSGSKSVSFINQFFYLFYSIPLFWLATLMVVFFTSVDYGSWTHIFPSIDIVPYQLSFSERLKLLLLPTLLLAFHSISYIYKQMQSSLNQQIFLPYTTTALAKGLHLKKVLFEHNLRNAMLPMITILTGIIPSALAGSIIIEVIFNIPGIGRLLYTSIQTADWNIVFGLLLLVGLITIISYLIGDLLYSWVNPKIRYVNP